jgi:C1A family cysteine protease
MLAILSLLLLGLASAARPGTPQQERSWNKEFTVREWRELDHTVMFNDWSEFYGETYETLEDETYRFKNWLASGKMITEHNTLLGTTYKMRLNQFSALTWDEFQLRIHGKKGGCLQVPPLEDFIEPNDKVAEGFEAPTAVDWEAAGDVTPVKNQGQCGSCWAFASNGAIECDYSINKGTLNSLSEQELVDCTRSYGNAGCNGGWWYNAFDYVIHEGGLCNEKEYPYTARDGNCKDSTCGTKYDHITSDVKVTPDSDSALGNAVAIGCNAVGVDVTSAFQHYSSGVFSGTCGTSINHGVTAVGYGTSGSSQYWKVKNSWGQSWGDQGYIYICRNCGKNGSRGECGINMYPYYVRT